VLELPDGELAVVLSASDDGTATVSRSASYEDGEKVSMRDVKVVFPTEEMLDELESRRDALDHAKADPRWTNDRIEVGVLADLALKIEFAWPNGRDVYGLVYALYRGIRKSNFQEHGPYNADE